MFRDQLEFTVKKLEVFSQNVENMQNEFIKLNKTTQTICRSVSYQSNGIEHVGDLSDSRNIFDTNIPTNLYSNYNTIISKLESLE